MLFLQIMCSTKKKTLDLGQIQLKFVSPKLARLKPTYLPKCLKNVYIPSVYLLQLGAISVNVLAAVLPAQSYLL